MSDLLSKLTGRAAPATEQMQIAPQKTAGVSKNGSPLSAFGVPSDREDGTYRDGKDVIFVVDGYMLVLPPFEDTDYLAVENHLRTNRKAPADALADAINQINKAPEAVREALLDRAYNDMRKTARVDEISRRDVAAWLDTRPGFIFSLWLQMKKRYPGMTEEHCEHIMMKLTMDRAMKARDDSMAENLVEIQKATARNGV